MGLVLELQEKAQREREEQLKAMVGYLRGSAVDARLVEETVAEGFGSNAEETVIRVHGKNISRIRLVTEVPGATQRVSHFRYEIFPPEALPGGAKRALKAKLKPVKADKVLHLFGGRTVAVRWAGGDIVERLNADRELSRLLVALTNQGEDARIEVRANSPAAIEIRGPGFIQPPSWLSAGATAENDREKMNKIFGFEIYDRIARHVNDMLGSG